MQGFPGAASDLQSLPASMLAIEQACSLIQMHMNPSEAERVISSFRSSSMPYQACRFILEGSQVPNARFQAAGTIGDAAIREWALLTDENKRSLILFCLNYVMERAGSSDAYVQSKVSSVAARLLKRGWLEFSEAEKIAIFNEVNQSVLGVHGPLPQYTGINFLESLVSEFSPSTSSSMGLPREFHQQCQSSLETNYLKEFYCWAQTATSTLADKVVNSNRNIPEEKACSSAIRLMFHILNWNFVESDKSSTKSNVLSSGIRNDTVVLKKFDRTLVKPGLAWRETLVSSGHTNWLLKFYEALREKYSYDTLWNDSPLAVSLRQLIVQLCSLAGSVFPSDNGETQIKHLIQILASIIPWIEHPDVITASIRSGGSESEFVDGCHALLSMASLTTTSLFENLVKSNIRPYGTIHLLSALTCEVVKSLMDNQTEEETWAEESLDILLETWNVILGGMYNDRSSISSEGVYAASSLFNVIVESHLKAAADSAFEDADESEYFHASVSKRDERLASYALIARIGAESSIPFLTRHFQEQFGQIIQGLCKNDPTKVLEELYWLLLITGHVLTDSGEGETLLIPEALLAAFSDVVESTQHPVVILSWSVINFSRQCLDPEMRSSYFSPRLMEAMIWFLSRWIATYLVPMDSNIGHISMHDFDNTVPNESNGSKPSRKILQSFSWENNQAEAILDSAVRISMAALTFFPGENELQALTCQKLLAVLVRRKHIGVRLVQLESWRELARAFANESALFSIGARSQRSLAETLVSAASCTKDSETSIQYLKDVMGPMTSCLIDNTSRSDLKSIAQQADAVYMVSCLLERLRGAMRATQPRTQKPIFEMGHAVMGPLLSLLEIYKNQSAVVYLILKFVVDFVDAQVVFLEAKETSILISFCMSLLQIYSSHNIGKVSLSHSSSMWSESQSEKYKDLRALLQLLTNICSKDLIDFSSDGDHEDSPDIAEVIYVGLHIVTPLISVDLLKYPKLSRDYFALVSHMLEIYPEKIARLNKDAFARIIATLDFGLRHQDIDIVEKCLAAINSLATFHFKERSSGKEGLSSQILELEGPNGKSQESISSHFLTLLLQILLFEDFRIELAGSAADSLLPLILCEQDLYQRLVKGLLEGQGNAGIKSRLANAFNSLTSSNNLSTTLDRPNRQKFRKNLHHFLIEISGFMRIK